VGTLIHYNMKSKFLSILFCFVGFLSYAQNIELQGNVEDPEGIPLPGVSILVKNSSKGTATEFDGNFIFPDLNEGDILVFSYVGFVSQEITVANDNFLKVYFRKIWKH